MGSERLNRNNPTKSNDTLRQASDLAKAWMSAMNPLATYTNALGGLASPAQAKADNSKSTNKPVLSSFKVGNTLYNSDGTPYDSPGAPYSIDQFGRPILHSSQTTGQLIKPQQSRAVADPQSEAPQVVEPTNPYPGGREDPFAPLDSAVPEVQLEPVNVEAIERANTWADNFKLPVSDSRKFFDTGDSTEPLIDTNTYGSKMTGPDGEEIPIEAEKWDEETNSMVDVKQDWSQAKSRAASARAFLDAAPGQGALGPLAAAEAAVGVSRGGDKDGSFLNLQRDGKTYQIRGSQADMATAAAKARAGKNIFGEYEFKQLPLGQTEEAVEKVTPTK